MKIQTKALTLEADTIEDIEKLFSFYTEKMAAGDYGEESEAGKTAREIELETVYRETTGKRFRLTKDAKAGGTTREQALEEWAAANPASAPAPTVFNQL